MTVSDWRHGPSPCPRDAGRADRPGRRRARGRLPRPAQRPRPRRARPARDPLVHHPRPGRPSRRHAWPHRPLRPPPPAPARRYQAPAGRGPFPGRGPGRAGRRRRRAARAHRPPPHRPDPLARRDHHPRPTVPTTARRARRRPRPAGARGRAQGHHRAGNRGGAGDHAGDHRPGQVLGGRTGRPAAGGLATRRRAPAAARPARGRPAPGGPARRRRDAAARRGPAPRRRRPRRPTRRGRAPAGRAARPGSRRPRHHSKGAPMTTTRLPLLPDHQLARLLPPGDEPGVGALATERGNLPLEAIDVRAAVAGLLARTVLTQTFANPYDEPLQATYVFPLPDRAAVTEFRMEVAGRVVEGVLEERAKARAAYDQAIAEGRRASIAEEERPGVFTMRVGNLMPGERATVRLAMAGPLPYGDGEATFRFPLVVAPRYVPGTPLPGPSVGDGTVPDTDAAPDASRITPPVLLPGFPNPVRLSLEVEIDPAGLPLRGLDASMHAVRVEDRDGHSVVRMQAGERANRDFVLRLSLGDEAVATALATVPDAEGHEGTFALTILPPPAERAPRPRDVVLVLDRSGSMAGWKMVAARRAAARMLDTLGDADRFAVLAFDNAVERPPALGGEGLVAASDRHRFRAVEFLGSMEARGGTEMAAPLRQAVDLLTGGSDSDRDRVLVLVTDGQVGNEDQLIGLLAPRLGEVRVFTVGVDVAVNEAFLKRLAGLGGGACELVESEDRLDAVMERIHRRVGVPLLTDLVVEDAGLAIEPGSLTPSAPVNGSSGRRLPALFAGAPLVVTGRWRGRGDGAVVVRGRLASGREWRVEVPASPGANPALAAVWARGRLRDLEDAYAAGRMADQQIERQIVATSLRFGVLCRFTAFVAVDTVVVNEGGRQRKVTQPVDAPQGWDMFGPSPVAAGVGVAGMAMAAPAAERSLVARGGAPGGIRRCSPRPRGCRCRPAVPPSRWPCPSTPTAAGRASCASASPGRERASAPAAWPSSAGSSASCWTTCAPSGPPRRSCARWTSCWRSWRASTASPQPAGTRSPGSGSPPWLPWTRSPPGPSRPRRRGRAEGARPTSGSARRAEGGQPRSSSAPWLAGESCTSREAGRKLVCTS